MMNVKELREAIANLPDDMEVIIQRDSEGNGFRVTGGVDYECIYIPDGSWSGDVYSTTWTAHEAGYDEEEWDEMLKKPRVLVIYPIN